MKLIDLTGKKFGFLLVLNISHKKGGHIYWTCKCDCGNYHIVKGSHLKEGKIISCGCYHKKVVGETFKKSNTTHGMSKTRLYKVFRDMKTRCYNSHSPDYKNYGGRGIKICEEWLNDYTTFAKWAYSKGYNENAQKMVCTIDRIDVNGDYCPDNCRWVGMDVQSKNKRNHIKQGVCDVQKIQQQENRCRRNKV